MFAVQNKKAYPAQCKWYNLVTLKYSGFKIENLYDDLGWGVPVFNPKVFQFFKF